MLHLRYFKQICLLGMLSCFWSNIAAQAVSNCDTDIKIQLKYTQTAQETAENLGKYYDILRGIDADLHNVFSGADLSIVPDKDRQPTANQTREQGRYALVWPKLRVPDPLLGEQEFKLLITADKYDSGQLQSKSASLNLGSRPTTFADSILVQKHKVLALFCTVKTEDVKDRGNFLDGKDLNPYIFPKKPDRSQMSDAARRAASTRDTFGILLFPFDYYSRCNDDLSAGCIKAVESLLEKEAKENNINLNIKRNYEFNQPNETLTYETAKKIANITHADFIIWGDYEKQCDWDSTVINCKYFAAKDDILSELQEEKRETGPFSIRDLRSLSSQQDIAGNIKDVVYYLLARTEYDNTKACNLLQKISIPTSKREYVPVLIGMMTCKNSRDELLELLKKAQELDSLNFNVLWWAARLNKERNVQLYYYNKIKSLYPDKYWDKVSLGHIIEAHKGSKFDLTLSMLNEYLQRMPVEKHHYGYYIRGTVNYELGNYEESIADFLKMQELDTEKKLNTRIALPLQRLQKYKEAADVYRNELLADCENRGTTINTIDDLIELSLQYTKDTLQALNDLDMVLRCFGDMDILKVKKLDLLLTLKRYDEAFIHIDSLNSIAYKGRRYLSVSDFDKYYSDRLRVFEAIQNTEAFEKAFMEFYDYRKGNLLMKTVPKPKPFYANVFLAPYIAFTIPTEKRFEAVGYSVPIQKKLIPLLLRKGLFYSSIHDYPAAEEEFLKIIALDDALLQEAHLELAKIALDTFCLNIPLALYHLKESVLYDKGMAKSNPALVSNTKTLALFKAIQNVKTTVTGRKNRWLLMKAFEQNMSTLFPEDSLWLPEVFNRVCYPLIHSSTGTEKIKFIDHLLKEKKYYKQESRKKYELLYSDKAMAALMLPTPDKEIAIEAYAQFLKTAEGDPLLLEQRLSVVQNTGTAYKLNGVSAFDKLLKKYQKRLNKAKKKSKP